MKVLTLKQPWATLVAENLKQYEFRTWKTNYRGEILIHAGIGIDKEAMEKVKHLNLTFPSKRIIAKATIIDCIELTDEINKQISKENELIYGNKKRTGYAFKLDKIQKLNIDEEIKGQLGLWNYDIEEE